MSNPVAAKILRMAIRKLKKHGVATSVFVDEKGAYCAAGAIYSAAGASDVALAKAGVLTPTKGGFGNTKAFDFQGNVDGASQEISAALRALEKVIRRSKFGGRYGAYRGIYTERGLAQFSDDHPELVISAMEQAYQEVRR